MVLNRDTSTRKVLYQQATSPYDLAYESDPDIGYAHRRAREILYGLPELVVMATKNPVKYASYGFSLNGSVARTYEALLDLKGLEDLQSWILRGRSEIISIPEAEEPYLTARENAHAKLVEYIKFIYGIFSKWTYSKPGLVFAVDDDFSIMTDGFTGVDTTIPETFQPGGAIKSINGARTSDPRSVADKYCRAVEIFGTKRDLRRYGLSKEQQSLPVIFDYNLAAGVLKPDTSIEGEKLAVNIYSHQLQIPGYLLPFNSDMYYDGCPVIWKPAIEGIGNKSMGEYVREATLSDVRQRNTFYVDSIFRENFDVLKELVCDDDSSKWDNEGKIEIEKE